MIENDKKMGYCRRRGGSATGGVMPRLNRRAFVPRRQAGVCPAAAAIITEVIYYKGSVTK